MLKICAILAAIPLAMGAAVAATGVVVVDVRESGPGGHRIVVPVPLALAEAAIRLVPAAQREKPVHVGDAARYLPVAGEVLAALVDAPDADLVRVDDGDEHVRIAKVGQALEVRVDSPREKVRVTVPLSAAQQVLRQVQGGSVNAAELVGLLRQARFTNLVEVEDGHEHVKITVY